MVSVNARDDETDRGRTLREYVERLRTPERTIIWHYTTPDGLLGILKSGSLWATSIKFLNDAQEYAHGLESLIATVHDQLQGKSSEARSMSDALEAVLRSQWETMDPSYVVSFCRDGDLLSQWRGYSGSGGFAIGFDAAALMERWGQAGLGLLMPVIYSSDENLRESMTSLAKLIADTWEEMCDEQFRSAAKAKNRSNLDDVDESTIESLAKSIYEWSGRVSHKDALISRHKHPSFKEEDEWRFVLKPESHRAPECELDFRVGPVGITPYVRAAFQEDASETPIRAVRIGPCREPQLQRGAVQKLLSNLGYEEVDASCSVAPYRA